MIVSLWRRGGLKLWQFKPTNRPDLIDLKYWVEVHVIHQREGWTIQTVRSKAAFTGTLPLEMFLPLHSSIFYDLTVFFHYYSMQLENAMVHAFSQCLCRFKNSHYVRPLGEVVKTVNFHSNFVPSCMVFQWLAPQLDGSRKLSTKMFDAYTFAICILLTKPFVILKCLQTFVIPLHGGSCKQRTNSFC